MRRIIVNPNRYIQPQLGAAPRGLGQTSVGSIAVGLILGVIFGDTIKDLFGLGQSAARKQISRIKHRVDKR